MRAGVIGGSIAGSMSALLLARAGHDVVVIESDDTPLPDRPDEIWFRRGVPQSRQAHAFMARFVKTLAERAPDVLDTIRRAGAIERAGRTLVPASAFVPGVDEEVRVLNARRSLVEAILRAAVIGEPKVSWLAGAHVRGVRAVRRGGIPVVHALELDDGSIEHVDVALDATGRRTQADRWLASIGARPPSFIEEPCDQQYFTRFYRLRAHRDLPALNVGFLAACALPWGAVLMFPGDNDTLQVAVGCLPEDDETRAVRDARAHHALARAVPYVGEWVARAEPISDVAAMGSLHNYARRLVVDGAPVVGGLHLVGDATVITNPQYGRGVSLAVANAADVVDVLERHPDDVFAQALEVDAALERLSVPALADSIAADRIRKAAWRAALRGEPAPAPDGSDAQPSRGAYVKAVANDPVVARRAMREGFLLEPLGSWRADADIVARVRRYDDGTPPPFAGYAMTRAELRTILDTA